MKLKRTILAVIFNVLLLIIKIPSAQATSTNVGNGGDIVDRFLENTRYLLREIAEEITNFPSELNGGLCDSQTQLSSNEKQFCHATLWQIKESYRDKLNQSPLIPFELSGERLYAKEPDGSLRPVLAITSCGTDEKIIFDYDGVKGLSPKQMLRLLSHEYFHKIPFHNEQCFQDNASYGPFVGATGGRRLIDALATAIVDIAIRKNRLQEEFGIIDVFKCSIIDKATGLIFPSLPQSPRLFFSKRDYDYGNYQAGVGILPRDPECAITENYGASKVSLRMKIEEHSDCRKTEENGRQTTLELFRDFKEISNQPKENPQIISRQVFWGENPICFWSERGKQGKPFISQLELDNGKVFIFSLEYVNSIVK